MTLIHLLAILGATLWSAVSAQYAMELAEGLSPRYYLGVSEELQKRQSGFCPADQHTCLDINATACCQNSQYCVINLDYSPGCCAIGSNCQLPCGSSQYQCSSTATVKGKATVTAACCPRSCTGTSLYKCDATLGPGCCSYGFACQSGGGCTKTLDPTTSNNAIASEIPSGCTTSQITCASSIGGGCCGIGSICTMSNNGYYCASASQTAQRTGADGSMGTDLSKTTKHSGLSSGAKAGIGGGIGGLVLVLAGGGLYFCVRHRRANRPKTDEDSSGPPMSQKDGSAGPRPTPGRRQTADYFGPDATLGPYTEDLSSPGTSPGANRGVPISPHSPGDIAAPVEIDSRDHSNVTSPSAFGYQKSPEVREYPVELP